MGNAEYMGITIFFDKSKVNHQKMVFTLEARKLIVERMDKQFQSDLDARRRSNEVRRKATDVYTSLALLQKGLRSYDNVVFDLKANSIANRKRLEEILNRPDMRKL